MALELILLYHCFNSLAGHITIFSHFISPVHPSCLDYTEELTRKILTTAWQCTNCKTCSVCEEANPDEDEEMLFCDSCDLGYHMSCHKPPVQNKPIGNWVCFKCKPSQGIGGAGVRSARGKNAANHHETRKKVNNLIYY